MSKDEENNVTKADSRFNSKYSDEDMAKIALYIGSLCRKQAEVLVDSLIEAADKCLLNLKDKSLVFERYPKLFSNLSNYECIADWIDDIVKESTRLMSGKSLKAFIQDLQQWLAKTVELEFIEQFGFHFGMTDELQLMPVKSHVQYWYNGSWPRIINAFESKVKAALDDFAKAIAQVLDNLTIEELLENCELSTK